jgi:hypothetical protein
MIQWVLVISMFSPGGDFIRKYTEGPLNSKQSCVTRLKEIQKDPNLYGLTYKLQCVKLKKEPNDYLAQI